MQMNNVNYFLSLHKMGLVEDFNRLKKAMDQTVARIQRFKLQSHCLPKYVVGKNLTPISYGCIWCEYESNASNLLLSIFTIITIYLDKQMEARSYSVQQKTYLLGMFGKILHEMNLSILIRRII